MEEQLKYSESFFISDYVYENKKKEKLKLIYSGRSGKLVALSLADYELIGEKVIPKFNSKLFNILKKSEIIVDAHLTDTEAIIKRNQKAIQSPASLAFVILPTSFCNMGCTYCGQSHTKGALSADLTNKIINRISSALQKYKPKEVSISWFGGEPMVGYSKIMKISEALITIADQEKIKYYSNIVTNGSLLTLSKLIDLHEKCRVSEINLTFDGPEVIHDARRFLKNGKNNFANIVHLLQEALIEPRLKNVRYVFRTNIDKENELYIDEYLQAMHDFGFSDERIEYDLKAVYPWSNDVSNVEIEKIAFAKLEIEWMVKLLELGMGYSFLNNAKKITCVAISPYAEVISSSGKIFSCTEHPLVPKHELQDFVDNVENKWKGQRTIGRFDNFNEKVLTKQVPCSSCKFLGVCGGACPKHWEEGHIPCPSIKYNIQERLNIVAVKMGYKILTGEK